MDEYYNKLKIIKEKGLNSPSCRKLIVDKLYLELENKKFYGKEY